MAQILQGGGGALKPKSKNLLPENVKAGQTIQILQGNKIIQSVQGTFTSDGTAVASNILNGKTAYVNGQKIIGTIPSKSAATYTPKTSNQTIAAEQYLSGAQTIKGDENLVAANILSGKSIFGVTGGLDVLLFGALNISGGSPPYNPSLCYYWNGNAYAGSALNGTTVTFAGTPKLAYATISYAEGSSLGGNPLSTSLKQYTEFQNNQLKINGYAFKTGVFVVLGMK